MSFSYLGKSSILKDLESDEKLQDILKETEEELIKPILSGEVPSVNVQDFAEVVSAHNQYPPYDFEKARQEHKNAEYYVSDEYLEKSKEYEKVSSLAETKDQDDEIARLQKKLDEDKARLAEAQKAKADA